MPTLDKVFVFTQHQKDKLEADVARLKYEMKWATQEIVRLEAEVYKLSGGDDWI